MNPMVEITDLLVQRNKRPVLEIDHLAVEKGNVLVVVGPNGSGKTTLLLAQARLINPVRGKIFLNGQNVNSEPETIYRRRLALVMQDPLLFDTSVYENVAIGLRFRSVPRAEIQARVHTWLERLGISHLKDRRAHQLSGGEAQRVSLARALVLEPELLLLDEPFAALDPPTRLRLVDDLGTLLRAQHITTLFVTHDLVETARLADSIAILLSGQLRQAGSPEEVNHAPADAEVAAFLGHARL
jgi:tungstate transport system ATP-binding protein